jgi:PPOX class probable F420-dependent enzyme
MVEPLTLERERASGFAMLRSGVEHQHGVVSRVRVEHRKHRSLGLVREVEVAVPGEDALKAPVECQPTHVGDNPFHVRQPITRQRDHFRRRVDSGHAQSLVDQESRDRLAPATAEVEHPAAASQLFGESIVPAAASTGCIPQCCVASIKVDDGTSAHRPCLTFGFNPIPQEEFMPAEIPQQYLDLFQKRAFAHVATIMPDGSPQVTPVWVDYDGAHICINSARGRVKDKNLRRNPHVALAIQDPDNPYRYLQIRGRVAQITEAGADDHINKLSQKYVGKPVFEGRQPGEVRVLYKIVPDKVSSMG